MLPSWLVPPVPVLPAAKPWIFRARCMAVRTHGNLLGVVALAVPWPNARRIRHEPSGPNQPDQPLERHHSSACRHLQPGSCLSTAPYGFADLWPAAFAPHDVYPRRMVPKGRCPTAPWAHEASVCDLMPGPGPGGRWASSPGGARLAAKSRTSRNDTPVGNIQLMASSLRPQL